MQLRLDDIYATILNRPPETPHAEFLLATGHGDRQFIRHLLGIPDVIVTLPPPVVPVEM